MGKILVIAEKPSVGRDIAKVLGCKGKGEGYLFSDDYVVSWAVGHLITLYNPEDYDSSLKKWSMTSLPIIPEEIKLKPIAQTQKQLGLLKKLMNSKEIDALICATDSGREGELIFRYIYQYTNCTKMFKRLWISSMTDTAIKAGFKNLKDGAEYDNLFLSAKCRSEADWLVGMNASRAYTLKYNVLLSIGRVQTPTLALITARQKEINAFVSKDYFEVKVAFESFSGEAYSGLWFHENVNETKIEEEEKAKEIAEKVRGQEGLVKSITNEEKKQPPPLLFDLTELQRECNKRFGYSAKKTLSLAQDLYEKRKLITYPRTDSRYLSDDMIPKLQPTVEKLRLGNYEQFADYLLGLPKLPIGKRIIDNTKVTDHHAIIPTESRPNLKSLSQDEGNVYDLVVRRFFSVFYPNYVYNVTQIITEVQGETFITKGNTVIHPGFTEVIKDLKSKKKEEEVTLPKLSEDEAVQIKDCVVNKKRTEPPKTYTEASLLSAMENAGRFSEDESIKEQMKDSGIGTPATRAAIIERLLEVGYLERKGKTLAPTDKGMKLIEVAPEELKSPETTGRWEKGLSSIAKGKMDDKKFMASIVRYVNFLINDSRTAKREVVFEADKSKKRVYKEHFGDCPVCADGKILENSKAYYCSEWKNGCAFKIWKDKLSGGLTEEVIASYKASAVPAQKEGGSANAD